MPDDVFASLTDAQREAVEHTDGALLILAGPGSGKTRVVTHRVARLLQKGIAEHQLLALTFTNKAADEMRSRLMRMVGDTQVWVGTFHRFCARLLRRYATLVGLEENFTIYDAEDSLRTVRRALRRQGRDLQLTTPEQILQRISRAKNSHITYEQYQPRQIDPLDSVVADVYPAYQRELLAGNAADFDDLLLYAANLLHENPALRAELDERYSYILVDEYQDTNVAQYGIVRALSINYPNLAVTGDPDQSIYGWRGANLKNILEFERDFPDVRVVRLEQNYRSTPEILHVADTLISYNVRRKQKELLAVNEPGSPVRLARYPTEKAESEAIAAQIYGQIQEGRRRPGDFAIFYRTNALSRPVEEALRRYRIAYQVVSGVEFYQRQEIKDLLAYLRLINNPRDNVAFLRVVNRPPRGIGKTTLDRLTQDTDRRGGSLLDSARRAGLIESLGRRAQLALARFVTLFDRMGEHALGPVEEILSQVLELSGYRKQLADSTAEEDQQRLANMEELLTVARDFDMRAGGEANLEAFLEQTSLVNDTDDWDTETDRVSLMTLHAAKGLEFPVVFIIALEEGLLPHERARQEAAELEEERRLLFVGITRAEQELQLSMVGRRNYRGREVTTVPSGFAMELPRDKMQLSGISPSAVEYDAGCDDGAGDEPIWREEDFVQEAAVEPAAVEQSENLQLTTAAELLAGGGGVPPETDSSDEVFRPGMAVVHPKHGLGKIVQLDGHGSRRTATVNFVAAGQRCFVLSNAAPRPASQGG